MDLPAISALLVVFASSTVTTTVSQFCWLSKVYLTQNQISLGCQPDRIAFGMWPLTFNSRQCQILSLVIYFYVLRYTFVTHNSWFLLFDITFIPSITRPSTDLLSLSFVVIFHAIFLPHSIKWNRDRWSRTSVRVSLHCAWHSIMPYWAIVEYQALHAIDCCFVVAVRHHWARSSIFAFSIATAYVSARWINSL